ncbi:MAG: OmpH family outer membrane protein [Alistipes sp.]|jgi:outer membrane protein|nr:OmpH family outer membrane protein [Alistipes sp.]
MKKILFAALALALVVGCKNANTENAAAADENQQTTELNATGLAYVQVEYVLAESDIFKSEGVALRDKTEKAQKSWAQKEQRLQNEIVQLQEKYQKGLITTRDAQEKEQELQRRAANYQTSAQNEAKTLEEENIVFQNRMNDLLGRAIQEINADGAYKMIVNASALLDADETLDITQVVLAKVNELYKADKEGASTAKAE